MRSRISKSFGLWSMRTSQWVIFPERLFVGHERKNGSMNVARYRNPIFHLFPRIYTNWALNQAAGDTYLTFKHKLSFRSLFAYAFLMIVSAREIITTGELEITIIYPLSILLILILLMFREAKTNEKLLEKIAYEKWEDK